MLMSLALCLAGGVPATAQPYAVSWYTIDGGGGTSSGGTYSLVSTIGQPDAGTLSGGSYLVVGGFLSIPPAPEINVTPISGAFPAVSIVGGTAAQTFTIENLGTADLLVAPSLASSDFYLSLLPAAVVAPGASTTLEVTFDPVAVGVRTATLVIANNDSDENPVNISLQGTGLAAAPSVTTPTSALITGATATLGGNVTFDGGSVIIERGVVYSQTAADNNPVIGAPNVTKVTVIGTTGLFAAGVTGLTPTTSHSFKAFATNAIGTSYTSVATFTTTCPTITLASLPNGNLNAAYTGSATASGGTGPYTYAVTSGSLPGGLSLSADPTQAGYVSGTPTATGTFPFDITATDTAGAGTCTGVQSYSVVIGPELGQDFFTLTPCRVLDTRNAVGPLGGPALVALGDRTFVVAGTCGIPVDAKAISLNIAVTQPTNAGNIRLHPGGTAVPLVSAINYKAGQTRSNNAVIPLSALGQLAAYLDQAAGTAHLILDVNGYFK